MAKLTLTYGTMGAGKSTLALQLYWQLRTAKRAAELWTFGDRSGSGLVTSRVGLEAPARAVTPGTQIEALGAELAGSTVRVLVVDEVQFASVEQIDVLVGLVDEAGIDVHTFGLGADFRLQPFAGTARLFAMADEVRELPLASLCWCGERGRCNARVRDGEMVRDGEQRLVGDVVGPGPGGVGYVVLCRRHFYRGESGPR